MKTKQIVNAFENLSGVTKVIIGVVMITIIILMIHILTGLLKNPVNTIISIEKMLDDLLGRSLKQCYSCSAKTDDKGNKEKKPCSVPFFNAGCWLGLTVIAIAILSIFAKLRNLFPKSKKEEEIENKQEEFEQEINKAEPGAYDELVDELYDLGDDPTAEEVAKVVAEKVSTTIDEASANRSEIRETGIDMVRNILQEGGGYSEKDADNFINEGGEDGGEIIPPIE